MWHSQLNFDGERYKRLRSIFEHYLSSCLVAGLSFVLTILIARQLGPEQFSEYSILLSWGGILIVFLDGGFKVKITRSFAGNDREVGFYDLSKAFVFSSVVAFLIFSLGLIFSSLPTLFLLVVLLMWTTHIIQLYSAMFRGMGKLKDDAVFLLFARIFSLFFILIGIKVFGPDTIVIFSFWVLSNLVIVSFVFCKLEIKFFSQKFSLNELKGVKYLFLMDLFINLNLRFDVIYASSLGFESKEIGLYAASFRILEIAYVVALPLRILLLRRFRQDFQLQDDNIKVPIAFLFLSFIGAISLVGIVYLFSNQIILILFGETFIGSVALLHQLAISILFIFPSIILTEWLISSDREKLVFYGLLFSFLISVVMLKFGSFLYIDYNLALNKILMEASFLSFLLLGTIIIWIRKNGIT